MDIYGYNRTGVKNLAWSRKGEVNETFWHSLVYDYYFLYLGDVYADCDDVVHVMFSDIVDAWSEIEKLFDKLGTNEAIAWYIARSFYQLAFEANQQFENNKEAALPLEALCTPSFYYKDEVIHINLPCTPVADYLKKKREEEPACYIVYAGDRDPKNK